MSGFLFGSNPPGQGASLFRPSGGASLSSAFGPPPLVWPSSSNNTSNGFSLNEFPASTTSTRNTGFNETVEDLKRQISYLSAYALSFKEKTPTDIQLKPNDGQPCIPAHRAILEPRCRICKSMLDSNGLKAPPSDADIVTVSELNTEELRSFLEFVYTGNLDKDRLKKHIYSLYVAAVKYEIPYLQELCERYMLQTLNTSNAVTILQLSYPYSNNKLKETSFNLIVEKMKDIVSSKEYHDLARNNPDLSVQITRAFVRKASIDAEGFRAMMRDEGPMPIAFGRSSYVTC